MQSVLHIDLETYSSIDLGKCGVYKYTESEDFEILLFAYAFDAKPVKVIDLAQGEELPDFIKACIKSENIIKVAHNAAFERICLSRYLCDPGKYLDPKQWRCTMIHAYELGLPASLDNLGKVHNSIGSHSLNHALRSINISYPCYECKLFLSLSGTDFF